MTAEAVAREPSASDAPTARAGFVLALIVICQLMIVLDATVVNVALPPIQEDLGFTPTGLSWVVNAYTLAFGGLLLLGGRLGDALGRRRVFVASVALFTLASLVGGAASDEAVLVAARAAQGVGAAIAAPSALAILLATFAEGTPRNKALGLFSAMSAAGGTIGLLVGGALTSWLSWRWVLFINVPVGAAVVLCAPRWIVESVRTPGRFELAGALTSTAGMTALVYGFIRAGAEGWGDGLALAAFGAAAVLLAAFVAVERRAEQPLLPLRLFERRPTASAYLAMLLVPAVLLGMYFFSAQFLQIVLGYSAIETGLAFLPMAVLIFAGSQAVPRFLPRVGPWPFMIAGAVALTAASLWLTQISASSGYFPALAGPLVLFGLGGGLLFMPLSAILLSGVRLEDSGAAAGAMQAAQQLGAALGVAILVSVFAAVVGDAQATAPEVFASGAADAFAASTALAAVVLLLIVFAVRPPRPAAVTPPSAAPVREPRRLVSRDAQQFWDAMHSDRDPQRPGRPHPYLVDELSGTSPGSALELGCGDGANAIWLAAHGWTVTAVDVSQVALDLAAAFARRAGVGSRIRWERADLRDWTTTDTFDLAAAFFLHTPLELDRPATIRRAAERVRAGGTLLVIGHYTLPPWSRKPGNTDSLLSAGELASALALDERLWSIGLADQLARSVTYRGQQHIVLDSVLHAVRAVVIRSESQKREASTVSAY